jgi:hypothetical protein
MKTSNIFKYSAIGILLLSLASCGDSFLEVEPSSSVPIDGYYTTKAHIDEAVTASYDPMHWYDYFSGWCPLFLVSDSQGDDLYVGGGSTSDQAEIHLASQYKSTSLMNFGGAWTTSYSGINRSNLVIADAESSNLPDAEKAAYIAEGTTTRAFYYLVLWKYWGNIPYYDKNLTSPYIAPQKSEAEVYKLVTSDLEKVIDSKVLPMKETPARAGHATQAFAEMLYADFVMYQKDESKYKKALSYMEDIINSKKYRLMDDFSSIWEQSNEWCDESIYEINYFSKGSTRDWGNANAPGGTVIPAMIGVDGLTYTASDAHKAENPNYVAKPDFVSGWGFCDVSKECYDAYEPNDQRRDGGILDMETYAAKYKAQTGDNVTYGGRYQNTGLFLRKYLGRPGGNANATASSDLGWDNNQRIYRYAETLLNASELALRTGDNAKAQNYFQQVRDRAFRGNAPYKQVSLDNLLNERRLEFVGEGKRYYDLIRFGKASEVLKPGGGMVLNAQKTAYDKQGIPERIQWTENKKYLPIPQSEVDAAQGTIVQNPY